MKQLKLFPSIKLNIIENLDWKNVDLKYIISLEKKIRREREREREFKREIYK